MADSVSHACELTVAEGDFHGSGRTPPADQRVVLVDHRWSVDEVEVPAERVPDASSASA